LVTLITQDRETARLQEGYGGVEGLANALHCNIRHGLAPESVPKSR
jgi:hypothetical protein